MSMSGSEAGGSSPADVDFLDLCTDKVCSVENLVNGESLLNHRQCRDLSSKLSKTTLNIRELVSRCRASAALFRPALENLYLCLEKAKLLVGKCAEEDWCAAAVFQCQNENAFREILLEVGLRYNAIYELAKRQSRDWSDHPEDLRQSAVFDSATDDDVLEDKKELQKRLDELASGNTGSNVWEKLIPGRAARRQSLAKYLLDKIHCISLQTKANISDAYSPIFWRKVSEPQGTWGWKSDFLGRGSGATGVNRTTWLGIHCAKKVFSGHENEDLFIKEAHIFAHLKHPNIVNFICCGNGRERGDRFIAMELMEMDLFDLIEEQKKKGEHFLVPVAIDMMVQMARGVYYLHGQGVAHRDLKPENVVVNRLKTPHVVDHYCLKLVDFGVSKAEVEVSQEVTMTYRGIGTTSYRAPEAHPNANPKANGRGKVDWFKADAFSFAMTCAHVLSLERPFEDTTLSILYKELVENEKRPKLPDMYPNDLVVLLKDCWKSNPRRRPSFVEISVRLEEIYYNVLQGQLPMDGGLKEDEIGSKDVKDFIKMRLDPSAKNGVGGEVEGDASDDIVWAISCTCGQALQFFPQLPSIYTSIYLGCICNICWKNINGDLYHCETCLFDAHPHCAEIKEKVEVTFHNHPLHLLLQNYYIDKPDVICFICEESLQESDWVFRCEQCDFDVHALCSKFPGKLMIRPIHRHFIILRQCPPCKNLSCGYCNGEIKEYTWHYACGVQACAFHLHPKCYILSWNPLCIFDSSHRLSLICEQKSFHCGTCGALGFSWSYHCDHCDVDIHPDCVYHMDEEECNWNRAYEKLLTENGSKDDRNTVNMISELLDKILVTDHALGACSSSSSKPPSVMTRVRSAIQRSTVAENPSLDESMDVNLQNQIGAETRERIKWKKMAVKEARLKLRANEQELLSNVERIILDLQSSENMSQHDVQVLAVTHERLKRRQQLVKEQRAMQEHSKMGQGPRIAVFYQWKMEDGKWLRELLTSLRAGMNEVGWGLLCEEPGHEHIVQGNYRKFNVELGEEKAEKLQPMLACGLQVVRRIISTLEPHELAGLESVTIPSLEAMDPWDLRPIDLEKHGHESTDLSEDREKSLDILKGAAESAAEWFRSDCENDGLNILKTFGLQRVCYKVTEEGDFPRYRQGSFAWLCTEHLNSGLKDGTLESSSLKYYNVEDDSQLRCSHVSFEE